MTSIVRLSVSIAFGKPTIDAATLELRLANTSGFPFLLHRMPFPFQHSVNDSCCPESERRSVFFGRQGTRSKAEKMGRI